MGDAEKKHLSSSNDLLRKLVIENFSNCSRRKGHSSEIHTDAKKGHAKFTTQRRHHSDWTPTSPKHSRSSTPKSMTGMTRDFVVPSSKHSFSLCPQDTSATHPFVGCGSRFRLDVHHEASRSNATTGSHFGASASSRSINRSNCNAISHATESIVSGSSMEGSGSSGSWKSSSRMNSVSDLGRSSGRFNVAPPVAGRNANVVRPLGRFESTTMKTANSTGLFGNHRPHSTGFDARMQDSTLSLSNSDRAFAFDGRRNTTLYRIGETSTEILANLDDQTTKIYPCIGQLAAGRATGPRCDASTGNLYSIDWDSPSQRLHNCYDDDDDVDDDDDDDDSKSIRSVCESIVSLAKMSSGCGSPKCDGGSAGQVGSSKLLDEYLPLPPLEDLGCDGFCGGDKGSGDEEDEDNWELDVCPWPDEWFPVAPDLQRAVARLALISLRDGEEVAQDLSRLKDANILPPDFFIPEEEENDDEDSTCGDDSTDLDPGRHDGFQASPSLMKVVAERLFKRLMRRASSCKTEAGTFADDPDCDKRFRGLAKKLSRTIRKKSASSLGSSATKSSNCFSSSSSSTNSNNSRKINVSANNSTTVRRRSAMPVLSQEGLFLKCLAECETRMSSLRGTRGRHIEQKSRHRDHLSTGTTGSQSLGCGNQSPPRNKTVFLPDDKTRRSCKSEDTVAAKLNDSRRQTKSSSKIQDDDVSWNKSHSGGKRDKSKKRHRKTHSKQGSKNTRSTELQSENQSEAEAKKRRASPRKQPDQIEKEKAEVGSCLPERLDLSENSSSLENLVADVVRGLYTAVRGKLERLVDEESVEAMSLALLRPRKADLEVREFVLMTVIEHIVWLVRHHHTKHGSGTDLEGTVRTLAEEYVDTILTNAVLKVDGGHTEARRS